MTTQEAFQDAAYWRARAKQLEEGIDRALKESTSMGPEQYANRVWSILHNVRNVPTYYQRITYPVPPGFDIGSLNNEDFDALIEAERDWMSRE